MEESGEGKLKAFHPFARHQGGRVTAYKLEACGYVRRYDLRQMHPSTTALGPCKNGHRCLLTRSLNFVHLEN